jgi:hypothetical protein
VSIERLQSLVGAFPLKRGSRDSALIVPGSVPLTIVVEGGDSADEGEVLLEVYLIP